MQRAKSRTYGKLIHSPRSQRVSRSSEERLWRAIKALEQTMPHRKLRAKALHREPGAAVSREACAAPEFRDSSSLASAVGIALAKEGAHAGLDLTVMDTRCTENLPGMDWLLSLPVELASQLANASRVKKVVDLEALAIFDGWVVAHQTNIALHTISDGGACLLAAIPDVKFRLSPLGPLWTAIEEFRLVSAVQNLLNRESTMAW